ncbi:uncharacterized protein LOC121671342 [Corvus kubaryi]|uniref:uncharacterized protein LOC121671342 n=1 Tax=Corvus kubaryi TaxID=68294 RepID=UPI001C0540A0|nr:uncharacterized protein LOC121671342 [Corvus kubaryi]
MGHSKCNPAPASLDTDMEIQHHGNNQGNSHSGGEVDFSVSSIPAGRLRGAVRRGGGSRPAPRGAGGADRAEEPAGPARGRSECPDRARGRAAAPAPSAPLGAGDAEPGSHRHKEPSEILVPRPRLVLWGERAPLLLLGALPAAALPQVRGSEERETWHRREGDHKGCWEPTERMKEKFALCFSSSLSVTDEVLGTDFRTLKRGIQNSSD